MKKFIPVLSASLCAALAFSGCETSGQSALAGAATGAAIGGLLHGSGRDAMTGAAIGAGAGYLLGRVARRQREDAYERGYYDGGGYRGESRYPMGSYTGNRGFVRSPYRPHHTIDVRGIPPGAQVIDPSCERIFINP
jgi:hypothetical protein